MASSGFINVWAAFAIACFSSMCCDVFSSMLMSITCGIDLIYRAGLMDEVEAYLFGKGGIYEC